MEKLVAVVGLLALSACASNQNMNADGWGRDMKEGLDSFLGHPVYHFLDRLGPVVDERWVANEKLYVLAARQTAPHERISAGASELSAISDVDQVAISHTWGCYIRIFADANGTTRKYDWMGNRLDCKIYVEQLKRWPAQY